MRRHTTTVFLCTSIPAQRANTTSIRVAPPLALAPSASLRESPNGGDSGARGGVDTRAAASHLRAPPLTRGSSFWFLRASRSDCYSGSRHQIQVDLCVHRRLHPP